MLYMNQEQQTEEAFVSSGEAAAILGVTPVAVWQMIRDGRLSARKVGRYYIIRKDVLDAFAKDYVKGPGPRAKRAQTPADARQPAAHPEKE